MSLQFQQLQIWKRHITEVIGHYCGPESTLNPEVMPIVGYSMEPFRGKGDLCGCTLVVLLSKASEASKHA
jgi:hypothetical protein